MDICESVHRAGLPVKHSYSGTFLQCSREHCGHVPTILPSPLTDTDCPQPQVTYVIVKSERAVGKGHACP